MSFDLDVILAAHGAGDESPANAQVRAWACSLEASAVGVRVSPAFHKGQPSYAEALQRADRAQRLIIPLLTSDGYHAERLRQAVRDDRTAGPVVVANPVGTDEALVHGVARHVAEDLRKRQCDIARTTIVVVGHGTARHAGSSHATRAVADAIAHFTDAKTLPAFLDQTPTIEDAVAAAPVDHTILVVSFLLGGGDHVRRDLPERLAATTRRCLVIDAPLVASILGMVEREIRRLRSELPTLAEGKP